MKRRELLQELNENTKYSKDEMYLTITATQELVVPRSIPITSPASELFHLLPVTSLRELATALYDEILVVVPKRERRPI